MRFFYILLATASQTILLNVDSAETKYPVIDLTFFNGEPMAFLRFFYLRDEVDYFVVIESDITFSGKQKKYFNLDKYNNTLWPLIKQKKLIPFRVSFPPSLYNPNSPSENINSTWDREIYLRNCGKEYVLNLMGNSSFILIVSDADELPNRRTLSKVRKKYTTLDTLHKQRYR